jgi:8-oxo-dGTP diphosphatase
MTLHDLCLEIQEALDSREPSKALHDLLDRVEREQTHSKQETYDALMSFLPTDDDARYDVIADELDGFVGWSQDSCQRWASEPRIDDTLETRPIRVIIGVWTKEGRHLIGRRAGKAYHGCWEFPGGKREPHETNEATLVREWKEETGLDIVVGRRVFTGKFTTVDLTAFHALAYLVTVPGEPITDDRAHTEWRWSTWREIHDLPDSEVTPSLKPIVGSLP